MEQEQRIAFEKAAILCSKSEKCSSEIREKLYFWGLPETSCEAVIDELKSAKYIDDERFARAYAKDKFRFNHWGKQKIAYMLRAKKISGELIDLALSEIDDSAYGDDLMKLIQDKAQTIKANDKYEKRNKLMRFALSRGFETDNIYSALKELGI